MAARSKKDSSMVVALKLVASGDAAAFVSAGNSGAVLAASLFERFSSRGEAEFQDRLLSAMRFEFGGHVEKAASPTGGA